MIAMSELNDLTRRVVGLECLHAPGGFCHKEREKIWNVITDLRLWRAKVIGMAAGASFLGSIIGMLIAKKLGF